MEKVTLKDPTKKKFFTAEEEKGSKFGLPPTGKDAHPHHLGQPTDAKKVDFSDVGVTYDRQGGVVPHAGGKAGKGYGEKRTFVRENKGGLPVNFHEKGSGAKHMYHKGVGGDESRAQKAKGAGKYGSKTNTRSASASRSPSASPGGRKSAAAPDGDSSPDGKGASPKLRPKAKVGKGKKQTISNDEVLRQKGLASGRGIPPPPKLNEL